MKKNKQQTQNKTDRSFFWLKFYYYNYNSFFFLLVEAMFSKIYFLKDMKT